VPIVQKIKTLETTDKKFALVLDIGG